MSYKSVLVMKSIPDLLHGMPDTPSLGVPRHMVEESSSSSTSGSSSDNECGGNSNIGEESFFTEPLSPLMFELHGHLEHTFEDEYPASYLQDLRHVEKTRDSELIHAENTHKQKSEIDPDRNERINLEVKSELAAEDSEELGSAKPILFKAATIEVGGLSSKREKAECLLRGSSADSALLPGVNKAGSSSMCVPRQSVIKSTFYNQALESPRLPTSECLPIDKEYLKHLERARRHYLKSGYSKRTFGGLREPLLEHFSIEEEDRILIQESNEQKRPSHGLPKSVSFDIAKKSPKTVLSGSARSRSLDYYKPRATSPCKRQIHENTDSQITKQTTVPIFRQTNVSEKFDTQLEEPLPQHKLQQYDVDRSIRNVTHRVTSSIIDASAERPASVPECDEENATQNYVPVSVYLKEQLVSAPQGDGESAVIEQYEGIATGISNAVHVTPGHSIQHGDAFEIAKVQEASAVLDLNKQRPTAEIMSGEEVLLQRHQSATSAVPENVIVESTSTTQGDDETIVTVRYLDSPLERTGTAIQIRDESTALFDTHERTPEVANSLKAKVPSSAEGGKDSKDILQPQKDTLLTASQPRERCDEKTIRTVQYQVTMPTSEDAKDQPDSVPQYDDESGCIVRKQDITTMQEPSKILHDSTEKYSDKTVLTIQFEDATLVSDHTTGRLSSVTPSDSENTIVIVQHQRTTPVPEHSSQTTRPGSHDDNESTILIVKHQTSTPLLDAEKEKSVIHPEQEESTVLVAQHQRLTPFSDFLQERTSSTMKCDEGGTTVVFKHQVVLSEEDRHEPIPPRRRPRSKEHQMTSPSAEVQCPTKVAMDQKLQRLSAYSKEESAALECIVDEMVYLSEEMNVLANAMSVEDSSEKYAFAEEKKSQQDPPTMSAVSSTRPVTQSKRDSDNIDVVLLNLEESTSSSMKEIPCVQSMQRIVCATSDQAQTPPLFHEHVEDITLESGSSSKTYFSHSGSSGTGRRSDNFSDFEEAGRESEVSLVEILDLLEETSQTSSHVKRESTASTEPIYVHLSDLYDMKHIAEFKDFSDAQEASGDRSSISIDELLHMSFEKETPYNITEVFTMYPNIAQDSVVQTTQTFYENVHGSLMDRASKSGTSDGGGSRSSKELLVELEHPYSTNRNKEHTSSVSIKQHKPGLFHSHRKSESIEKSSEQSLKQKVKASVANISRIIKGKQMSERYKKEESGEQRKELSPSESFEGAAGPVKRRSGLSSFKLSGIKSKEKVTVAPAFVEELTDQTVVLGHSITLSCRTSAHSDPTVEWFKDGIPIQGSDRVMISSTRKNFQLLTILAVMAQDLGIYACVATNHLGGASTCCIVKKAEIPCCPTSPDIAQMHEDAVLVIWKPVESSHPVTYTLQCRKEGGEWITLASNISDCCYFASNLTPGGVYSFRITCNSKAGMGPYSSPSAEVRIGEKSTAILRSSTQQTPDIPDEDQRQINPALTPSTHPTYSFQSEIQRGRFSTVRRCWEKSSGRPLAAKMIPYTPENKQWKLTEYHILKKLHHTNIVQLHAAYVSPRHLVLILELCEGLQLLQCLAEGISYSELEVRDYLWQMLSAVEFLHTNHILHLDIRSENTIVTEHKQLKLLDFGSAQVYTQDQVLATRVCQDFVENMAPELLEGHGAIPRTDVWAVGVTAFIMLSGDYPFCLDVAGELEKAIKQGKVKFTKCYAGLSGGAVSFLQSTLWANAWGRPSASECLQSPWLQEAGMATTQQVTHAFPTAKLRGFLKERHRKGPSC